jgi:1,4-dihydroxy-2-naphthoate octaprenyltransferase
MIDRGAPGEVYLLMGFVFAAALFYSAPALPLETSGFGELVQAISMAYILPAFAFMLQAGDLNRLLGMSTLFLAPLYMAGLIAAELPVYAADQRTGRGNLLVRAGWDRGMLLHNILVLSAYLVLGIAAVFGLPGFIFVPAILTLPLGLFQIWQFWRISDGARPNWASVQLTGLMLFIIPAYLVTFSFWTH